MGRKRLERQSAESLLSTVSTMLVPAHILQYFDIWDAREYKERWVTQSSDKWNEGMKKTVNQIFERFDDLKTAYQISQNFKRWYDYKNRFKSTDEITKDLYQWYEQAKQIKEFGSVIKMIRKHEDEIINFFHHGMTNAKAERLNGKIQRFVSSNYGIKDKDFSLYRIAGYFS